ncbi:MAG: flagellar protein FlaG protein [Proteobacteria bacterium]|nr:flagellar protein FlaG protein [Pseudomonadota bacterium]
MAIESIPSATVNTAPAAPSETRSLARSTSATELTAAPSVSEKTPVAKPPASEAQLQSAVNAANDFIKPITNAVEFSLDEESDRMVVKVMDNATKEVIRQIPSEEMLAIAQALDKIQGLLIKQKA